MVLLSSCGLQQAIRELQCTSAENSDEAHMLRLLQLYCICNFFSGSSGILDVLESAMESLKSRSKQDLSRLTEGHIRSPENRQVLHESALLVSARSDALRLESIKQGVSRKEADTKVK